MRKLFIRGCSAEAFVRACKKYVDTEENTMIKRMMLERDLSGKLLYRNRNEVVVKLINELLRYYEKIFKSPLESTAPVI